MATRNKKKMAALNKEDCEKRPRSNLPQISNVPRSQENYRTQVSEEIDGRVTKKLSQEFSVTENGILGALSRFDNFLMNPLVQGHSGTAPETSRNAFSVNQGTNEDDSQSDPHPEAGLFHTQTTRNSDPEDGHDMVIGVQKERPYGPDRRLSQLKIQQISVCENQSAVFRNSFFDHFGIFSEVKIFREPPFLHDDSKLSEMKVSGSQNKKSLKRIVYGPQFNFWLHVTMINTQGNFSEQHEKLWKIAEINIRMISLRNKICEKSGDRNLQKLLYVP